MSIKRFYFDVETSGLNPEKNAILQLAGYMEVNNQIVDKINLFIKPFPTDELTDKAFEIHGLNPEDDKFIPPQEAFLKIKTFLDKYIDKYDKKDKAYMVTFNGTDFDSKFLYNFFLKNDNKFMYAYFYPEMLDVFILVGYACQGQREKLGDGKLGTFAKSLGLKAEGDLHDAFVDVELTYQMFRLFLKEYPV